MLKERYWTGLEDRFIKQKEAVWHKAKELACFGPSLEAYRKVPLKVLYEIPFGEKEGGPIQSSGPFFSGYTPIDIVDGNLLKRQDVGPFVLLPLKEAFQTYGIFLKERAERKIGEERDSFALLTYTLSEGGVFIYVPPGRKEKVQLHLRHHHLNSHVFSRIHIVVGKGSSLSVISESLGQSDSERAVHQLVDVVIEANSHVTWTDLVKDLPKSAFLKYMSASLKRDSFFEMRSATNGSSLFRQKIEAELLEEGANVSLKGAWHLEKNLCAHTEIKIIHKAPHTRSSQHFKGTLRDQSRSSFEGKIVVEKEAQKTEAYQLNNNLVLGEGANAFTKPNLEIFADDVKASHGATVSQLSEEEIFYMRARGISQDVAFEYLARGFLDEVFSDLEEVELLKMIRTIYAL